MSEYVHVFKGVNAWVYVCI